MNILDFIGHIKHNSLSIQIKGMGNVVLYDGDIGGYKHSVAKEKLNKRKIVCVIPDDNFILIMVEGN